METIKLKSLGMEGEGQEPSTVEEFDSIAKKTGTCLQRAREYVRFHVTLGNIRQIFLHGQEGEDAKDGQPAVEAVKGVEETSGIERKTKPVLDKDGKPQKDKEGEPVTEWDEKERAYFDRVVATLVANKTYATEDEARASFQPIFDAAIRVVGFPAEKAEPKERGPKKLAAKYKLVAAKILTLNTVDGANANQFSKINKTFTATGDTSKMFSGTFPDKDGKEVSFNVSDKDAELLGWLVKEYTEWKTAQTMQSEFGS